MKLSQFVSTLCIFATTAVAPATMAAEKDVAAGNGVIHVIHSGMIPN